MKKRCLSGHRYAVNIAVYESYPDHIDIVYLATPAYLIVSGNVILSGRRR